MPSAPCRKSWFRSFSMAMLARTLILTPSLVLQGLSRNWSRCSWCCSSSTNLRLKAAINSSPGWTTAVPFFPSRAMRSPSWIRFINSGSRHIPGIRNERARMAAWETIPPLEVIMPLIRFGSSLAISPGNNSSITRIPSFCVSASSSCPRKWSNR